ncbi:MAG TPA: hypothetical protein DD730_14345 [Desulfosporosinus sp.]|jgi:uncharacterized RDD family membrane protein YckC|nr:hypothetical protein [Desulfosporosinus sp.]
MDFYVKTLRKEDNVMYCSQCGKQLLEVSNFCNFCGTKVQLLKEEHCEKDSLTLKPIPITIQEKGPFEDTLLTTELLTLSDVIQVRPWVRFWARMIDLFVVSIFVALLVGVFIPHGLGWELFSILIRIISAILLEAYLLSTWGMTFGKSLLQVCVRDTQGRKLNFSQAIKRCVSAYAWGLGFGLPIVSLIFAYRSYDHIQETGVTKWDLEGGSIVRYNKIGIPRIAVVVSLFLGLIWLELFLLLR